jgi:hypothetical protein
MMSEGFMILNTPVAGESARSEYTATVNAVQHVLLKNAQESP